MRQNEYLWIEGLRDHCPDTPWLVISTIHYLIFKILLIAIDWNF